VGIPGAYSALRLDDLSRLLLDGDLGLNGGAYLAEDAAESIRVANRD
jgi:hypothetical protein